MSAATSKGLAATRIAEAIVQEVSGVSDASCVLVSQIGRRIDDPAVCDVRLSFDRGGHIPDVQETVCDLVVTELGRFHELRGALVDGRLSLF